MRLRLPAVRGHEATTPVGRVARRIWGQAARSVLVSLPLGILAACGLSPAPPAPSAPATLIRPTSTSVATATPRPTPVPSPRVVPTPTVGRVGELPPAAAAALTAVPGLQATSAAVVPTLATVVTGIVESEQTQELLRQVTRVLAGVNLNVEQTPPGALPADTTRLMLRGTDTAGALAQLQPFARQLAAQAALAATTQLFPNATIDLAVQDASGNLILRGTRQPGYPPEVTSSP